MASALYLYLASRSPRRRELLKQAGIPFQLLDVEVDESVLSGEAARDYVERLARSKAQAASGALPASDTVPVLAADTTVALGEVILGKPEDKEHAVTMLMSLSGRSHTVHTGIALCRGELCESLVVSTHVHFSAFSREQAIAYAATGEPLDKAGGYGIQGFGGVLVKGIEGSYSNVVGLPIKETVELADRFGVPYWQESVRAHAV